LLATAVFLLTVLQRVFSGPLNGKWSALADLSWRERCLVVPATALMFVIGIFPQFIIGKINTTVVQMVDQLKL
jgi:NADH-quinone oxidoreductase subunit M